MTNKHRKINPQIEINDLMSDAINNAIARRHSGINVEYDLSEEEARKIAGGLSEQPIIYGGFI